MVNVVEEMTRVTNSLMSKSDKIDNWLSMSIMFFFIIQSANSSIKTVFPQIDDFFGVGLSTISGCLILFFIIRSMRYVWKRNARATVISYLLFGFIYLVSIFLNIQRYAPIDALVRESMLWTMLWWIPMGLIIYSIKNKAILFQQMVKWSYLLSVVTLMAMVSYFGNIIGFNESSLNRGNYNMFFSYMLVFPLIIHLNEVIDKNYKVNLPFFIIEFVSIILNGSRGALLCIGGFLITKFLLGNMSFSNKIKLTILTIVGAGVLYFGSQKLFEDLTDFGITSRTIEKIAGGTGAESNDRWIYWGYALDFIQERPLLGYGLGGDFYEMYVKVYGMIPANAKDATFTVHNGFLQILMCFGVFFGTIAIIIFMRPIFYFSKIKNLDTRILMVILFSVFIIPNFTTGDGVFIKPGIALYIYLFYNWLKTNNKQFRVKI